MMKKWLVIILITLSFWAIGQKDTMIYYKGNNVPAARENALKYIKVRKKNETTFGISTFYRNGDFWENSKIKESYYLVNDSTIKIHIKDEFDPIVVVYRKYYRQGNHYKFKDSYENGILKIQGFTKSLIPLHLEGEVKQYYVNGELMSISTYEDNQELRNKNWLEDGTVYEENIFGFLDKEPEFPGGLYEFVKKVENNTNSPDYDTDISILATINVHFVVDENGDITNIRVIHLENDILDLEPFEKEAILAIRSIKEKWIPGKIGFENVRVHFVIPIKFKLN